MEGIIKVNPADLTAKSGQFSSAAGQVQSLCNEMISKVQAMSGAFTGTTAESYISKFNALKASMDTIHNMIQEHVRDLNEMAERYSTADAQGQAIVDDLPPSNLT